MRRAGSLTSCLPGSGSDIEKTDSQDTYEGAALLANQVYGGFVQMSGASILENGTGAPWRIPMRPLLWGENRWLCSTCGEVEYAPEPPRACNVCSGTDEESATDGNGLSLD